MKPEALSLKTRVQLFSGSVENKLRIAYRQLFDPVAKPAASGSVQQRQDELIEFYQHFESFVEALCDASQFGYTPRLGESYMRHRLWLVSHYAALRPFLLAYLFEIPGEPADCIQSLLSLSSLDDFLVSDDGLMITRITYGREALSQYGEHLKQLAAA